MLYDLTRPDFEGPREDAPKAKHGHSRDQRSDCRPVVLAVVLSAEGFPLACAILPGNTSDKTPLRAFLQKIEAQYGKAPRIWIRDRGIPTEEVLREMRARDPPVADLVGAPRARWKHVQNEFEKRPGQKLREGMEVKLLAQGDELYVLVQSQDRRAKEVALRRRQLARLLRTLRALRRPRQRPWQRDPLLHKRGAAHPAASGAWRGGHITRPRAGQPVNRDPFKFELLKDKLKEAQARDGYTLLRAFRAGDQAAPL